MIRSIIYQAYIVISKIEYFYALTKHPEVQLRSIKFQSQDALLKSALKHARHLDFVDATYVGELGTLGYCYKVGVDNKAKFLKIYFGAVSNLPKESILMGHLNSDLFSIESGQFVYDGKNCTWILLPFFDPVKHLLEINDVQNLIHSYDAKLSAYRSLDLFQENFTFKTLIDYAVIALEKLHEFKLIPKSTYSELRDRNHLILREYKNLEPKICHGDLSSKNIMQYKNRLVAIDWEDAFWGFEGYDFLYWLTFIENKHHIQKSLFGKGQMSAYFETSILSLIILLKSWLSLLDGSMKNHRISFNERLKEVMILC